MASPNDPTSPSKRSRDNALNSTPAGAQAEESLKATENTPAEDESGKAARARRQRAARQAQNTIEAVGPESKSRRARTDQPAADERSNTDPSPRATPEHISERYSKVGDDYHFPDGNLAFRDRGNRLSTPLENSQVIRDMIAIAQARGWSVEITGTREFRRRAWQEAQAAGLTVRNYEPTDLERQQLARRLGRERQQTATPTPPSTSPPAPEKERPEANPHAQSDPAARESTRADRVYRGRLIAHGVDRYQFDPREEQSYYVILDDPQHGEQLIWGKDLQRAIEQSLSRAREGQDVVVRQVGAKPVTVARPIRDEQGQIVTHREVKTHVNRWLVETEEFLRERAKLADVVRDVGIDPNAAVARHPELAGTYADLRAARLVALNQNYKHPADIDRFVDRTREAIAQEIERGEPLGPPLSRARYHGQTNSSARSHERAQQRTL